MNFIGQFCVDFFDLLCYTIYINAREVSFLDYEYVDSVKFNSQKLRLVSDSGGRLFVRKSVRVDARLAEKLKGISCPYIVKLVEFGEDSDGAYVIEEYVRGETAAERSFTQKQAVKALLELCAALEALHSAKIVHRDVKPSNIIIAADGHIRLIDFDASRIEKTVQDKDTQILGTEGFAPPEQFGFSQTDSRSDIYSFGVTMKLLLAENAAPFAGIIRKCTALDPNDRYKSISAVKAAIRFAALKRLAAIPAAAALLAGFAVIFSLLWKPENPADHTSSAFSGNTESSAHESDTAQLFSSVTQSESSADNSSVEKNSESSENSQSPQSSRSSQSSKLPESSQPPQSSEPAQSSEPPVSSQPTQSSEPTESSQPTQSSEPPESSQSSQSSQIPETSEPPVVPETPKITYTTFINGNGYYEDECDYIFYDDPTVYGHWQIIGALGKRNLAKWKAGALPPETNTDRYWLKGITINPGGSAKIDGFKYGAEAVWTNGYIIWENDEAQTISELFTVTRGDTEYLFIENKNGDYTREKKADAYFIYTRTD